MFSKSVVIGMVVTGALIVSCNTQPEAFVAGTEFGLRLGQDVKIRQNESERLRFLVDYPEHFHGDLVEAVIIGSGGDATITMNSLQHEGSRICVGGDLVEVINSKGTRGRDDDGGSVAVQTVRSAPTTTMMTQNICTGQGEQQSCTPMTYPTEVPGPEVTILQGARNPQFQANSEMVFRMRDLRCSVQ
jgi:hypothetical protein